MDEAPKVVKFKGNESGIVASTTAGRIDGVGEERNVSCLMSMELGKMKMFWKSMVVMNYNNDNLPNVTDLYS